MSGAVLQTMKPYVDKVGGNFLANRHDLRTDGDAGDMMLSEHFKDLLVQPRGISKFNSVVIFFIKGPQKIAQA
jgi:hypothetical protein